MGPEEGFDALAQLRVIPTSAGQIGIALVG
jgi:hypothetical protein